MKQHYGKLRGKMFEKGYTNMKVFAKTIEMSPTTLSHKLNDKMSGGFNQKEVMTICRLLDIPVEQIGEYFFA